MSSRRMACASRDRLGFQQGCICIEIAWLARPPITPIVERTAVSASDGSRRQLYCHTPHQQPALCPHKPQVPVAPGAHRVQGQVAAPR